METLEQVARVALTARLLGHEGHLPAADVERLTALRARAGYPPPVCEPEVLSAGAAAPVATPRGVTLSREDLVRLVAEAVERFRT
jgi:hypothetical protein